MPKLLAAAALTLACGLAAAHAGHGFAGPHWHAGDLLVPASMLACAAAAFWLRKKKP